MASRKQLTPKFNIRPIRGNGFLADIHRLYQLLPQVAT